jgi:hypothetical protein
MPVIGQTVYAFGPFSVAEALETEESSEVIGFYVMGAPMPWVSPIYPMRQALEICYRMSKLDFPSEQLQAEAELLTKLGFRLERTEE